MSPVRVVLIALGLAVSPANAQSTPSSLPARQAQAAPAAEALPGPESEALLPEDLPVSLERIKRKLAALPPPREDGLQLLRLDYYIAVYGQAPAFDFLANFDVYEGPVPHGAPTHRDFLMAVTPRR